MLGAVYLAHHHHPSAPCHSSRDCYCALHGCLKDFYLVRCALLTLVVESPVRPHPQNKLILMAIANYHGSIHSNAGGFCVQCCVPHCELVAVKQVHT